MFYQKKNLDAKNLRKNINTEIKKLKKINNLFSENIEAYNYMLQNYQRICDNKIMNSSQEYNLRYFLTTETIKSLTIKISKENTVIFEFVYYPLSKCKFAIIYNEFLGYQQKRMDIFTQK